MQIQINVELAKLVSLNRAFSYRAPYSFMSHSFLFLKAHLSSACPGVQTHNCTAICNLVLTYCWDPAPCYTDDLASLTYSGIYENVVGSFTALQRGFVRVL